MNPNDLANKSVVKQVSECIVKDAGILRALGIEAYYLGNQDYAFKYFAEALVLDEEFRDIRGKAIDLNNIGRVCQQWGKPEKALEYFQKALRLFEELKDVRSADAVRKNIEALRSSIRD